MEYDLTKGYIKREQKVIAHHDGKPEGERKVIADYPYDEVETIETYVLFTEKELAEREIQTLKTYLQSTDYKAIKFAEGVMSAEEYAPIKAKRQEARNRINELELI